MENQLQYGSIIKIQSSNRDYETINFREYIQNKKYIMQTKE